MAVLTVVDVRQRPGHRRRRCSLVLFVTVAMILVSSLVFCFPLYLKEVTAPVTGYVMLYCIHLLNKLTERNLRSHSCTVVQCLRYNRVMSITVFVK